LLTFGRAVDHMPPFMPDRQLIVTATQCDRELAACRCLYKLSGLRSTATSFEA